MKFKLLLLSAVLYGSVSIAQFGPQQIISSNTQYAYISKAIDIDNDGFIDVLKSSGGDYKLQWHRNLDGQGNFGEEILISDTPAIYNHIGFVDLDTDGDNDILLLMNNPDKVVWLENLNGLGSFGSEQLIVETSSNYIVGVTPADIDNDGDIDLIGQFTDTFNEWLVWYENLDGLANFEEAQILVEGILITSISLPLMEDIDNDGLLDMLTAYELFNGPGKLVWYKNLGNGVFDEDREIYQFDYLQSDWTSIGGIKYTDINTDGKEDIVITSYHDDLGIFNHWFENVDDLGSFGDIQSLAYSGIFCDIDNDGDNDILKSNRFINRIYWVENIDGLGTFSIERTITTEVDIIRYIDDADFNADGLIDVVSASSLDNKIAWYENTGILGVKEITTGHFEVHPNPTRGSVNISAIDIMAIIELFDNLGRKIKKFGPVNSINLEDLNSGIYFIKITDIEGASETLKIMKL